MKFRTIRRLVYLKKARHRRGHGIHSPFLFQLITNVVEDRKKLPEYKYLNKLKIKALKLLSNFSETLTSDIYQQFNLPPLRPRRLYKKVELPLRYCRVLFRLVREFKPRATINYGPALGINLAAISLADSDSIVYQINDVPVYELFSKELLKDSSISNIYFFPENSVFSVTPEFLIVNYPDDSDKSRSILQNCLNLHGDNDVLIIRGIHESKTMENIWRELITNESVRVTLDFFEIGIALFHKGLQKENFIHRF